MQTQRIFVALSVSDKAKKHLEATQNELKDLNKKARVTWVDPSKMHITVVFLGDLIAERVEQVKKALTRAVQKQSKFGCWLEALDAFPNKTSPNIIIVRVGDEHFKSGLLQTKIVSELKKEGMALAEKPWQPHITIGRIKRPEKILGFNTVELDKVVWEVDKVILFESLHNSNPPKYNVLATYEL